jgi:nucleotide-binding universal stress UspA family protein
MDETDRTLPEAGPGEVEPAPPTSIVVGHDRSPGADGALELALQLASELHAPALILRAWSLVTAPRPANWTFGYVPSEDELADAVHDELVADTRARVTQFPDVDVTFRVDHRGPARALIGASREARMLVVGSRGLGGFGELVLGSVSDQCVRYAACPVLVARHPR